MNQFRRYSGKATLSAVVVGAMLAAAACGGASSTAPADTGKTPPAALAAAMDKVVQSGIPGIQVVIDGPGGHRVYTAGTGDLSTGAPMPADGRVRIGSNTKSFVAVVVLQLVAEGKVELDAPIERYLPGVVTGNGSDGNRVTVRQLLQHTSGLPDYLGGGPNQENKPGQLTLDNEAQFWQQFEAADLVRTVLAAQPPIFEPGAKMVYTNTNYLLLGMLVDRVAGRPVAEEISRRILEPLGLRDTYFPPAGETVIRGPHARGYEIVNGKQLDLTDYNPSWAGAAGAMVATPADLNRFFTALLAGKLLAPAQLAEMQRTTSFDRMPSATYGLGLVHLPASCGKEVWGHGGSIPGFGTRNGVAADGTAVTVTVNRLGDDEKTSEIVAAAVDAAFCGA
ncbi:serine hydrolase domain-containing protein [Nocardia altamirensis]|uniref:serine hydrolase domain-containing protein n=1 Tax=Nocardia altamirensis TaxID=472158 RepID=UPI0008401A19|nr:serine hydrolase domain-containing protein [Nocardia altamirensis]